MKAKYSAIIDTSGKLYVDCSECERGGNGQAENKCACGWKIKKGGKGGCFLGEIIKGYAL